MQLTDYVQAPGSLAHKLTPQRANNILNTIQRVVSIKVYKAISIILKPCCDVSIVGATAVCGTTGTVNLSLTLSPNISLLGVGTAQVVIGSTIYQGVYNDINTISLTNVVIPSGAQSVVATLFLATSSARDIGAWLKTPAFSVTIPSGC